MVSDGLRWSQDGLRWSQDALRCDQMLSDCGRMPMCVGAYAKCSSHQFAPVGWAPPMAAGNEGWDELLTVARQHDDISPTANTCGGDSAARRASTSSFSSRSSSSGDQLAIECKCTLPTASTHGPPGSARIYTEWAVTQHTTPTQTAAAHRSNEGAPPQRDGTHRGSSIRSCIATVDLR